MSTNLLEKILQSKTKDIVKEFISKERDDIIYELLLRVVNLENKLGEKKDYIDPIIAPIEENETKQINQE